MTRPALRVVRDSVPPPPLELPRLERAGDAPTPWYDRPWFGAVLVAGLFTLVGVVAIAMQWVRP